MSPPAGGDQDYAPGMCAACWKRRAKTSKKLRPVALTMREAKLVVCRPLISAVASFFFINIPPPCVRFATCGGSIPPDHNENSTAVAVLFCVGDPSGRIVQVISLREITCCSCGEALLSPNVPTKGIARHTFRRTLRNLRGFDPSGSQRKQHGCCRAVLCW